MTVVDAVEITDFTAGTKTTTTKPAGNKPGPGEIALSRGHGTEILRTEVGSTLHGTGLGVSLEDHDEMGVYVEHPASTIGLGKKEHYTTRTAADGQKSQAGDTDLMLYSVRKWAKLAMNGNPSVLLLLFAPDDKVIKISELGHELRGHYDWFSSKRAGRAFLGYMEKQRQRMVGQRGRAGRVRITDDCSACDGDGSIFGDGTPCGKCLGSGKHVDWKYAMHMLRLGYQGVEYLSTGRLTLPVPGEQGDWLREVRQGHVDFAEVVAVAESLEAQVKRLLDDESGTLTALPDEPNVRRIEQWVVHAHLKTWGYE